MDDHSEPRWRIGQVSARTGLTTRTLRYYEELGLLRPTGRLVSGHRVYANEDLRRLYRISLLRQLGLPLSDIAGELENPSRDLSDTIGRHIGQVDQRMAAIGRHRERMITVRDSQATGSPTDEELLDILHDMAEIDHGFTQRVTLLVYDDIEAVHDHLVAVFGFGPGTITRDESGRVVHGELHVGDGVVWMHPPSADYRLVSPASLGASTHCMAVIIDDVDRHHERAAAAGATIVYPPRDMAYGFREYGARDLEGGLWSFMTPLSPEGDSA
ncbi:MAG TPA: MerR family transcriptional regulator [Propionibacteriaceae bacterium]